MIISFHGTLDFGVNDSEKWVIRPRLRSLSSRREVKIRCKRAQIWLLIESLWSGEDGRVVISVDSGKSTGEWGQRGGRFPKNWTENHFELEGENKFQGFYSETRKCRVLEGSRVRKDFHEGRSIPIICIFKHINFHFVHISPFSFLLWTTWWWLLFCTLQLPAKYIPIHNSLPIHIRWS